MANAVHWVNLGMESGLLIGNSICHFETFICSRMGNVLKRLASGESKLSSSATIALSR
jgi:hypothetical protein